MQTLVGTLPARLYREIRAGHFVFVRARGAEATVAHIASLINEARGLRTELDTVLGSGRAATTPLSDRVHRRYRQCATVGCALPETEVSRGDCSNWRNNAAVAKSEVMGAEEPRSVA